MDYQDCQHEGCNKPTVYYVEEKQLYVCSQHRLTHYLEFPFIALIDPFVVKKRVRILDEKRKEFIAFAENLNNGVCSEEYQSLSDTIKEELQIILENLEKAISAGKHFKYESLYKEVGNVENLFSEDKEYISVIKAWSKGLTQARLEDQRSIELIKVELKQKYEARFERFIQKIREQRRANEQKHQKEISALKTELKLKEEQVKTLESKLQTSTGKQEAKINEMRIQQEQAQRHIDSSFSKSMDDIIKEKEVEIEDLRKLNQTLLEDFSNENYAFEEKIKSFVENLKEAENENARLTEEAKKAESNFEYINTSLISKLNLSECSYLSLLYKIITGENKQIGPETKLELKLDNPNHMEFLTSLNKRMPDIDQLDLDNIPLNCQEVKTFLAIHFPNKVRVLNFNCGSSVSSCVPFYLEELVEVSKRVTGVLYIYNFEVSQDQLVALFSANRHKKYFGLPDCKLSLASVPDFGGTLAGSTMQRLNLDGWGYSSYGDWGNNESHFENLIAGLSKEEDFRKNLKWISMNGCGMKKNVVEKILADHGFGHVEIEWDFLLC